MRRNRINYAGNDVGFHLITMYICPRSRVIDRIEKGEQVARLIALPELRKAMTDQSAA